VDEVNTRLLTQGALRDLEALGFGA